MSRRMRFPAPVYNLEKIPGKKPRRDPCYLITSEMSKRKASRWENLEGELKIRRQLDDKARLKPTLRWERLGPETYVREDMAADKITRNRDPKRQKTSLLSCKVQTSEGEEDFIESSSESEEEDAVRPQGGFQDQKNLTNTYYAVGKLLRFIEIGNQTATLIALCSIRDFDLTRADVRQCIRDEGGVPLLVNLVDCDVIKCKLGALKILQEVCRCFATAKAVTDIGGIASLVKALRHPMKEVKAYAAEVIASVSSFRRARRNVRQCGGIGTLVRFFKHSPKSNKNYKKDLHICSAAANALWSCCKTKNNRDAIYQAGIFKHLKKLLDLEEPALLRPLAGLLSECCFEDKYRKAIQELGLIEAVLRMMTSSDRSVKVMATRALKQTTLTRLKSTSDLLKAYRGLQLIVDLCEESADKELLAEATGCLWAATLSKGNHAALIKMGVPSLLETLITQNNPDQVQANIVGCISELLFNEGVRSTFRSQDFIHSLCEQLKGRNWGLLKNATKALGMLAENPNVVRIIEMNQGIMLIWSLLKTSSNDLEIKSSAAAALVPCLKNMTFTDPGQYIRNITDSLQMTINLLHINEEDLPLSAEMKRMLTAACSLVAEVAKDVENLGVMTDQGAVKALARIVSTLQLYGPEVKLRAAVADAIAACCKWSDNGQMFDKYHVVRRLANTMKYSDNLAFTRSYLVALRELSYDPTTCVSMHDNHVVENVLPLFASRCKVSQDAAAICIGNIRRLAMANEFFRLRCTREMGLIDEDGKLVRRIQMPYQSKHRKNLDLITLPPRTLCDANLKGDI